MTAARPDTWMPLYWGDYLRDTGHLSAAEHGAYLLLIGHYWTTGKPLPNDDTLLARIARMAPKAWKQARSIIEPFFQVSGNEWSHKRIAAELAKWERLIEAKSNAGKASALARAQQMMQQNVNRCSTDEATNTSTKFNPSPSPSPVSKNPPIPPKGKNASRPEGWTEEHEFGFENLWKSYAKLDVNPKGPARKEYLKAVKSGADPAVLAEKAAAYCAVCRQTETLICHLRTWLFQRRWEDDVGGAETKSESQIIRERAETDAHQATIKRSEEIAARKSLERLQEAARIARDKRNEVSGSQTPEKTPTRTIEELAAKWAIT